MAFPRQSRATFPNRLRNRCALALWCNVEAFAAGTVQAEEEAPPAAPSPWILLPTFSNNPKLGASVGALGAYARKFDDESKLSMFGVGAQWHTWALYARCTYRNWNTPQTRYTLVGMRLLLEAPTR